MHRHAAILLVLALACWARGQVTRLGAMGDSLTDEYSEQAYSYARNWTMLLVQQRGVNMGPTATGQPGGTWGEPRRTGYASNWARYGADSSTALTQGQHTGLASQVGPGGVSHALVAIGANDFSPSSGAYFNIYFGLWSTATVDAYVAAQVADVRTAVDALRSTGVGLVLCNYVDFGVAPVTRQYYPAASLRNRVTAVIARVNQGIEAIAQQDHLLLIDLNAMGTAILGTNTSLRQFLRIGNVDIQLFNRDTTTHTNPLAGFVDDGAHPHTTIQGVFANVMMTALNMGWNAGFTLFSDQEILAHGGIAYGGSNTLAGQVGAYSQYIRSYLCPTIAAQPAAATACVGGSVAFGVSAGGGGTYTYQWRRDTVPLLAAAGHIAGVNSPTLTISGAAAGDAGTYDCVVSGACGGLTSAGAGLVVFAACPCSGADIAASGSSDPLSGPDGFLSGEDFDAFIVSYFKELRRSNGMLVADLTDGVGAGGPDGFLTGTDFDRFVALYFAGC